MKKAILLSSVFAIGAAFAGTTTVDGQNVLGTLKFSTEGRPNQMLVAVPFAGYGAGNISPTDLVSTSGLPEGTILRAVNSDGSGYDVWRVTDAKTWEKVNTVSVGDQPKALGSTAAGRGSSLWLDFPTTVSKPGDVLLLGQMGASSGAVTLAKDKLNLIGNPSATGSFDLAANGVVAGAGAGDMIYVQTGSGVLKTYKFSATKKGWTYTDQTGMHEVKSITVNAGEGCWFFAKSATSVNF